MKDRFITWFKKFFRINRTKKYPFVIANMIPDKHGNILTEEALISMKNQINNKINSVGEFDRGESPLMHLERVSHTYSNARITSDKSLVVDIKLLDTEHGRILSNCINASTSFETRGFGLINEKKEITSFDLISVDAIQH